MVQDDSFEATIREELSMFNKDNLVKIWNMYINLNEHKKFSRKILYNDMRFFERYTLDDIEYLIDINNGINEMVYWLNPIYNGSLCNTIDKLEVTE